MYLLTLFDKEKVAETVLPLTVILYSHKSWLLCFDEADALFSKRSQSVGANDQFANQNIAYLLQRIEKINGIVMLETNFTTYYNL